MEHNTEGSIRNDTSSDISKAFRVLQASEETMGV
jgi:hypothetical protein